MTTATEAANMGGAPPALESSEKQQQQKNDQEKECQADVQLQQQEKAALTSSSTTEKSTGENESDAGEERDEEATENDVESDSEETAAAEEAEKELKGLGAEELFSRGKEAFKVKDFSKAADLFSRAVERKLEESGCKELDPSMGVFYLWFGDALLSKEETTDEMLQHIPQTANPSAANSSSSSTTSSSSTSSSSSSSRNGREAASGKDTLETGDDELAFQMLELAKKCLAIKLNYKLTQQPTASDASAATATPETAAPAAAADTPAATQAAAAATQASPAATQAASAATEAAPGAATRVELKKEEREQRLSDANDLSFACLRLGDLQLMNNQFEDAARDFAEAVAVRSWFCMSEGYLLAPKVSLAQATFFSGNSQKALELFKDCESLAKRICDGLLPIPKGTSLKALMEIAEDLGIQITDIQQQQQQQNQQQQQQRMQGSQSEAKSLIPVTTSSFDSPVLASSSGVKRIAVSGAQVSTEQGGSCTPKKRRIDLKAIQIQQQQQVMAANGSNKEAVAAQGNHAASVAAAVDSFKEKEGGGSLENKEDRKQKEKPQTMQPKQSKTVVCCSSDKTATIP